MIHDQVLNSDMSNTALNFDRALKNNIYSCKSNKSIANAAKGHRNFYQMTMDNSGQSTTTHQTHHSKKDISRFREHLDT